MNPRCTHTAFPSMEDAMDNALNSDMIIKQCPFCKKYGLSYASSEEAMAEEHTKYREHLKEKFPHLQAR